MRKKVEKREPTTEEWAHSKLLPYVAYQFNNYIISNVHRVIAAYLEAVERGEIERLLIFAPPRHGKPVWEEEPVLMYDGSYKKLKHIEVGDRVITHKKRPKKVTAVYKQGLLPTVQIDTKHGMNPCTALDHPFLTANGWVEAKDLKIGNTLALIKNQTEYIPNQIVGIKKTGMRECRCLLVEDDHTFTIQNIVVHNTTLVGEYFPAWYLGRNPSHHIIYTTYNQEKGNDVGRKVRDQFIGDNFKRIFPNCTISSDSKSIAHIATNQRGEYFNVGMGGAIVGRGAHLMIIDDPLKGRKEAESRLVRKNIQDWYKSVAYTRLMPNGRIIVMNTRWHQRDISGYLLDEHSHENWVILDLKALAEKNDILGRKEGEALWPEFKNKKQLKIIRAAIGQREWNSQFQQRPTAAGGGMVKLEWIMHYDNPPNKADVYKTVVSWDTAYKPEQMHDPTAATVWDVTKNKYYLIDVINKRLEFPQLIREVKRVHELYHPSIHLIEGRATGQSLIQQLKQDTTIPVKEVSTKNLNNEIRFDSVTTLFEAGKVWLPKQAHWLQETEDQFCSFPTAPHDDIVDSTSQFLSWVNTPRYVRRKASDLYWK